MTASFSNPYGAVQLADGGTPRIITVKARANISGGYWVAGSSSAGAVGSSASSYVTSDIEGFNISAVVGSNCIGLALQDIASGTYGPVAQRGVFIVPVASGTNIGSVVAGQKIAPGTTGTVLAAGSSTLQSVTNGIEWGIGRALTTGGGGAEQFVAVSLNI